MSPASGYKTLTDDELIFLRHNRDAIKARLLDGDLPDVARPNTPPDPPPDPPCPFCHRSPCIGPENRYYAALHYLDPKEIERRQIEKTFEMFERFGMPSRFM